MISNWWKIIPAWGVIVSVLVVVGLTQEPDDEKEDRIDALERRISRLEQRVGERFTASGERYLEGEFQIEQDQFHKVIGEVQLIGGRARITLNTLIGPGLASTEFLSKKHYYGEVDPVDTGITNTYKLITISASEFMIESSSITDTNTVRWRVRGE